jgi:hypothetical protein
VQGVALAAVELESVLGSELELELASAPVSVPELDQVSEWALALVPAKLAD